MNEERTKNIDEEVRTAIIGLLECLPRSALLSLLCIITRLIDEVNEK